MAGETPRKITGALRPSPCPGMILPAKFTKKAPDSMNFVNFAGKKARFSGRSAYDSIGPRHLPPGGSVAPPGPS